MHKNTVLRIDAGLASPSPTIAALQRTLEEAGIALIQPYVEGGNEAFDGLVRRARNGELRSPLKTETAPEGAAPMTSDGAGYFSGMWSLWM